MREIKSGEEREMRMELLKSYLRRLSEGEPLEKVREDFVQAFHDVDASEILLAEQLLMRDGMPLSEVQRLCDIHAALFHGRTTQEQMAAERQTVPEQTAREQQSMAGRADAGMREINAHDIRENRSRRMQTLIEENGHPLQTFSRENDALAGLINEMKNAIIEGSIPSRLLQAIRSAAVHYAKKGDLLYPHLKVQYGISGPSDVMWTVDDEIRDEIAALCRSRLRDEQWMARLSAVLGRMEEMIYKEQQILFPNCAANFSQEEWIGIYEDSRDYPDCLGVTMYTWEKAEQAAKEKEPQTAGDTVRISGAVLRLEQLTALLNTIPLEITFVDEKNVNCYFNEGPKDFKRPSMALGREVFTCHPPRVEQQVRRIIEEFRNGTMDEVPVWMEKHGQTMCVRYLAVRDREGRYLGTLELVQNMEFAREHFCK